MCFVTTLFVTYKDFDAGDSMKEQTDLVEASARLRVSYHTAHRWVLTGKLKGQRRDGRWFVDLRSLEKLERERATRPEVAVLA